MFARWLQGFLASQQHPKAEKSELILWISFYQKKNFSPELPLTLSRSPSVPGQAAVSDMRQAGQGTLHTRNVLLDE